MEASKYGDGDWTAREIAGAMALWDHNNPHKRVEALHPSIKDAWMVYLTSARVVLRQAAAFETE